MARTIISIALLLAVLGFGGYWLTERGYGLSFLAARKSPTSLRATTRWLDKRLDELTRADGSGNAYEFDRAVEEFDASADEMLDWEISWKLRVASVADGVVWLDTVYWNDEGGLFVGGRCLWLLPPGKRTEKLVGAEDLFEKLVGSHRIGLRIGTDISEPRARALAAGQRITVRATVRAHSWTYQPTWLGGPVLILQLALDDLSV